MTDAVSFGVATNDGLAAPAGHDEAMIAKFDAAGKPPVEATPPEPNKAQRPEWLPEKFQSPEDLAKAYAELEKKLSQPKQAEQPKADQPKADEPKVDPDLANLSPAEAAQGAIAEAGLDYAALVKEYSEGGDLSEESYERLAKVGISKEMVAEHIEGQIARAAFQRQSVLSEIGGEQNFQAMSEWAKANLPKAELDAYNRAVEGDLATQKLAVSALFAKYTAANGAEPSLVGGNNQATSGAAFRSTAEMVAAMSDPRYEMDPAYRQDVAARLARSNIL